MRKILLCTLLSVAGLACTTAQATEVTFTTDEGYNFRNLLIYEKGTDTPVNGSSSWEPTVTLDLEPGTYSVEAALADLSYNEIPSGALKTFTVGNTPTTVNYSIAENYAKVRFTLTNEAGQPMEGVYISNEAESYSVDSYYYSFSVMTGADGTAEAWATPGKTYTASTSENTGHYIGLTKEFSTSSDEVEVALSYAGYHRVDVTFAGYYSPAEEPGVLYGGEFTLILPGGGNFYLPIDNQTAAAYVVVPDGEYLYTANAPFDADNTAYTADMLTVDGADATLRLDFSKAQPVTFSYDESSNTYFSVYKTVGDTILQINSYNMTYHVTPGDYSISGSFSDEASNNCYFEQHFEVADAPVAVTIDTDPNHYYNVAFDVNTPQGKAQSMCYVNNAIISDLGGAASPQSFQNGTYDYSVVTVWIDDYSYALPYMPGGTLTIQDADVKVPVDLTDHRFFRLRYTLNGGNLSFDEMSLTDSEDRSTVNISGGGSDRIGIGLKPGTYTVNGTLNNAPIHGTLTVPDDCPESLTVDMHEGASAIGSVETAGCLDAKAVAGGLQISATEGGHVSVSIYDTMGRLVLTAQAADGETVSTTDLSTGIYIARLQQGAALRSVKFVVR